MHKQIIYTNIRILIINKSNFMDHILYEKPINSWRNRKNRGIVGNIDVKGDNRENANLSVGNLDITGSNYSNIKVNKGSVSIFKDNKWVITNWNWTIDVCWINWQGAHISVITWTIYVWWNQGIITLKNWTLHIWSYLKIICGRTNDSPMNNIAIINGNNINIIESKNTVICTNWDCVTYKDIKKWGKSKIDSNFSINDEISFDIENSRINYKWKIYTIDNDSKKLWEYFFQKKLDGTVHIEYKWQKIIYSKKDGIRVEAMQ